VRGFLPVLYFLGGGRSTALFIDAAAFVSCSAINILYQHAGLYQLFFFPSPVIAFTNVFVCHIITIQIEC
jgi:hypothetical protein